MAWTSPPTFTAGQVVSASDLNAYITNNSLYLLQGGLTPSAVNRVGVADYTTTSLTFVDVDAANVIVTLTPLGGRMMVIATFGTIGPVANTNEFRFILDSATGDGDATHGLAVIFPADKAPIVTLFDVFTGLSVASHTVKLQYRTTNAANAATVYNNGRPVIMRAWGY